MGSSRTLRHFESSRLEAQSVPSLGMEVISNPITTSKAILKNLSNWIQISRATLQWTLHYVCAQAHASESTFGIFKAALGEGRSFLVIYFVVSGNKTWAFWTHGHSLCMEDKSKEAWWWELWSRSNGSWSRPLKKVQDIQPLIWVYAVTSRQ